MTAEIVNKGNNKVLGRDRTSFFDLRNAADAVPHAILDATEILGMQAQLTASGLGDVADPTRLAGLEIPYLSTLPQPSLEAFNADLTSRAQTIPTYDQNSNQLGACIPFSDLTESNFSNVLQFGPYADAMVWAEADHLAYDTEVNTVCNALATLPLILACRAQALLTFCVHSQPQASDFELCVDQLEGDVEELTIAGADDADLRFLPASGGSRAKIEADVSLTGIHSRVQGRMRSLSVRWKNPACLDRPKFTMNDSQIAEKPWLETWTSCPNLALDAQGASTMSAGGLPSQLNIELNPNDLETLRGELVNSGHLIPTVGVPDPNHENCGLSFISPAVTSMLNTIFPSLITELESAWYSGPVGSTEARALTRLFGNYRWGSYDLPGHDIDLSLLSLGSETDAGMGIFWETKVSSVVASVATHKKPNFFFQPPGFVGFSTSTEDHHGDHFDISYNITTGLLNKILNTRGASNNLYFTYHPTWDEMAVFGVTKPANAVGTDPARLNKNTMQQFHKAFKGIAAGDTLEIGIAPIFDPFVFMPIDPRPSFEIPGVGSPLAYGLENLSVTFKTKNKTVNGQVVKGKAVLRAHVTFLTKGFRLTIEDAVDDTYLRPHLDDQQWEGNVTANKLAGCAMYAHYPGSGPNCERTLEDRIASLIRNKIEPNLQNFVARVPSPKLFNSLGFASDPVVFNSQSKRQEGQNITFFGQITRP
jgi:hypothetical protein